MRKDIIEIVNFTLKHIEKHRINVENLLEKGVGVTEHPDIMDTIEKELEIILSMMISWKLLKSIFH